MKILKFLLFISLVNAVILQGLQAQDTTTVQTFTFNDITKRRGKFKFPDGSESYRKILMRYNLKCDPRTTRDQYDCGEWDYLTYTYIYGSDGKLDSTRKTHPLFYVNGAPVDSIEYIKTPFYNYVRDRQYKIRHTNTTSVSRDTVGSGTLSLSKALNTAERMGRSQFIYRASDLTGQGMTSGNITGIQIDVDQIGSQIPNFEIRMLGTTMDSIVGGFVSTHDSNRVYRYNTQWTGTGYTDIQFEKPFNWNGSDNVLIEFRFNSSATQGNAQSLKSGSTNYPSGIVQSGSNNYLEFRGSPQWANLGKEPVVTGNSPRTIEVWAKINAFNNAGLFQAGTSGTNRDFSLRTASSDDKFRAQLWGGGDFDFTYNGAKGEWHHYAMVYNGTRVTVYIDGQAIAGKNVNLATPTTDFRLGRWQGNYINGELDEVRVWNKAISQTNLQQWMKKPLDNSHPDYSSLIGYYPLNQDTGLAVKDLSPNNNPDGYLTGLPWWKSHSLDSDILGVEIINERPNVVFEKGVYTSVLDSLDSYDSTMNKPVNLRVYANPANGNIIPDNDPNHPSLITSNEVVWEANDYSNTYDRETGARVAWKFINATDKMLNETKVWYSPNYRLEIARYITPYGIGLDLGPDGFAWWYDVTDYVQYLRDSVDISAGNQQELIDLRFYFIKGTPSREVKAVNRVWGQSTSIQYKYLSDDSRLSANTIDLHPESESYKMKMRMTGHGHNSNDGSYPHCCEWKDNTHTLLVNGIKFSDWKIWQTNECAENPVFPQGGTWNGAREGWCPGDVVRENEFEIANAVSGSQVTLDYDITKVPNNNLGMGNGNYVVAAHLVQYGKAAHEYDVELYDVIAPNQEGIHSRRSGVCDDPIVVIRNAGVKNLTSAEIRYRVKGGEAKVYNWTGNLPFMKTEEVYIPVTDPGFYSGDGSYEFEVKVGNPNGNPDGDQGNNEQVVKFTKPVNYAGKIAIRLSTNNRPNENWYQFKDVAGKVLFEKKSSQLSPSTLYNDTIDFPEGCYSFYMHDEGNDGLNYWANPSQGSGNMIWFILDAQGNIASVKTFQANFGRHLRHTFTVKKELGSYDKTGDDAGYDFTSVEDGKGEWVRKGFIAYPNPGNGDFNLELFNMEGEYQISVVNASGKVVYQNRFTSFGNLSEKLDLSKFENGIYILQVANEKHSATQRLVIQK